MSDGVPRLSEHGHGAGQGGVGFACLDDLVCLVTTGQDGRIRVWNAHGDMLRESDAAASDGGFYALAVSPDSKFLAVGAGNSVQLYRTDDDLEFIHIAASVQLAVKALTFSPDGSRLAIGGDDERVAIVYVDIDDESTVPKTYNIGPNTRCLAWDPVSTYLAGVQTTGDVRVWDTSSMEAIWHERVSPAVDVDSAAGACVAWHPQGKTLAVAVKSSVGDVAICDRLSWAKVQLQRLKDVHTDTVTFISYSPNGRYIATAANDLQLVVWDTAAKEPKCLAKHQLPAVAVAGAWHPGANEIVLMLSNNQMMTWRGVVPSDMPAPHAALAAAAPIEDDEPLPGLDGLEDDLDDDEPLLPATAGKVDSLDSPAKAAERWSAPGAPPPPQPAFQSGACTPDEHFIMQYNMLGRVACRRMDDSDIVDTAFHDISTFRRKLAPIRSAQRFGFADLAPSGTLLASPISAEGGALVRFEPYESLSAKGGWERALPGTEEPLSVALGATFAAVVTDANLLRIFSTGGLQQAVISLAGAPVCLAARGSRLAVAWHAGAPTLKGHQTMHLTVYDVSTSKQVLTGPLPLSPRATLTWLSLSDALAPVAMDSQGVLRMCVPSFGMAWTPLFEGAVHGKGYQTFWPVGVEDNSLFFIACEPGQSPQVKPQPLIESVPLPGTKLPGDEAVVDYEAELLALSAHVAVLQGVPGQPGGVAAASHAGEHLPGAQLQHDKVLMRMFDTAIRQDRLDRALQIMGRCELTRTLEMGVKLANHKRKSALAERVQALLEARLDTDEAQQSDALFAYRLEMHGQPSSRSPQPPAKSMHGNARSSDALAAAAAPQENDAPLGMVHRARAALSTLQEKKRGPPVISKNPFARQAKSPRT